MSDSGSGPESSNPGSPGAAGEAGDVLQRCRLAPENLHRVTDPKSLGFTSTAEVEPFPGPLGQSRALDAISFAVGLATPGYNLFVSGPPGSGRSTTTRSFLERHVKDLPAPDDWVYLHNFRAGDRPRALRLPAGTARRLADDMDQLIKDSRHHVILAFENDRYLQQRQGLAGAVAARREPILKELADFARSQGFALESTPAGVIPVPVQLGQPLTPEMIQQLSESQRDDLERRGNDVQRQIEATFLHLRQIEREVNEQVVELDRQVAMDAVEPLFRSLKERYATLSSVVAYLDEVLSDLPNHLGDFRQTAAGGADTPLELAVREDHLDRYRVNVFVDNSELTCPPVAFEPNPTYYNLVGRLEHRASFGMMLTDFLHIRAGALHRANGGYLILEAESVLRNPFSWDVLNRALRSREIRIESLGEQLSAVPTATLVPEPVPLDIKVVLIGSPLIYRLLYQLDDEFRELFKIRADFSPDLDWDGASEMQYAGLISRLVAQKQLTHFGPDAVAAVVEESARALGSQLKLPARVAEITDLIVQAAQWAKQDGSPLVRKADVARAAAERERRSSLTRERIEELILRGTLNVETRGAKVGQLNGLSVVETGDYMFGLPSRVTATAGLGRGTLDSIERETNLSGPIHSKGVLTISGYLAEKYGRRLPLALKATLTFEQSYDEVEGDSASSTELYTLLSAIAEVPLAQTIAVTGSVDQHGRVQAVGGVTQKVEGFFRICRARGLDGSHGVMVPLANVTDLMLSDDIVEAVAQGQFHVWAVSSIDEGIEMLTGRKAGQVDEEGRYPEGTVHRMVADRLLANAERQRAFGEVAPAAALTPVPAKEPGKPTLDD